MDNKEIKSKENNKIVDGNKPNKNKYEKIKCEEDYGYDFIPTLNNFLNIDEQKVKTKKLEDIE